MAAESPKYDIAISFLCQDQNLAKALCDQLSNGLEVFFFSHNQEELAGSDGLESMREPFRNESRLNVVLYRPGWGKTPWTAVEEAARELVSKHGREALAKVAKMHFRTSQKVLEQMKS